LEVSVRMWAVERLSHQLLSETHGHITCSERAPLSSYTVAVIRILGLCLHRYVLAPSARNGRQASTVILSFLRHCLGPEVVVVKSRERQYEADYKKTPGP
jgi:hypothetical protein